MKVYRCAQCGVPISLPLFELDDVSRLSFEDQTPHVPRGCYLPMRRHPKSDWIASQNLDDVLLNLADVVNTHLGGKLNGCCGIDGQDGINTFCPNGHEIGIEFSDCWGPHDLRVPSRCVDIADVQKGEGADSALQPVLP